MKKYQPFRFKQFEIHQQQSAMKVGTDGVLLGAWADVNDAKRILDIGTGTGLIALMMAQRNAEALIDAVEIDNNAYEEAKHNFEISKWSNRLNIFHNSIQDFSKNTANKYDFIISNPPYFINSTKSDKAQKNQVRHTDSLSFNELLNAVKQLLTNDGKFCLVLPYTEGEQFYHLVTEVSGQAKAKQLYCTKKVMVKGRDFKPVERLLMEFSRKKKLYEENNLLIQNSPKRHDYTEDYINLTKRFYLFM
ncbi:MAG: tRNA1(Val) (adenine(37)-N6)-methyltransferase [Saprospiraceae bacterium]